MTKVNGIKSTKVNDNIIENNITIKIGEKGERTKREV